MDAAVLAGAFWLCGTEAGITGQTAQRPKQGLGMHDQLRKSAQRKILLILAAIVVILMIVAALAFETTTRMIHDRGWVAYTHRVLAELQEARAILDDALEEERNYLASSDDRFKAPFENHVGQFERKLDVLSRLLAHNSVQHERLSRLAASAQACFASMRAAIEKGKLVEPGTEVEITTGLQAGDSVILNPPASLASGSTVRVRQTPPAAVDRRVADGHAPAASRAGKS